MQTVRLHCVIVLTALLGILGASGSQELSAQEATEPDGASCAELQEEADSEELEEWLRTEGGATEEILEHPERYRAQILVREIVSREGAPDCVVRRGFRVDEEYVYPASAIKTVAALAAF